MSSYIDKIKEISKKLLQDGTVDMVIGFKKGTIPMMNEPCLVKNVNDIEQLVWDSNCRNNLANYLVGNKNKVGIVAKGCDSRNIVTRIIENRIHRDKVFVIGVPCTGMIDKEKVSSIINKEITGVSEKNEKIIITSAAEEQTINKADVLQENCSICIHRNPSIYDELVSDLVEEQAVDRYEDIRKIEAMSFQEKSNYFDDLLSPCIRCYACRNACPLCYCPTCFVDESNPQWVGKSQDNTDVKTFHLLRAYHCAGRCTDCGACVNACPMGINLRVLTKKLEKDCLDKYNWEAGLLLDERPPLDTFKPDDPENFIK
jgi:formate dehydrogenase subunit beta